MLRVSDRNVRTFVPDFSTTLIEEVDTRDWKLVEVDRSMYTK